MTDKALKMLGLMRRAGAIEIGADQILLAKSIDGVYDADPKTDQNATKYDTISIREIVEKGLQVIDSAAAVMLEEHRIPMLVFGLSEPDSIIHAVRGTHNGTIVTVGGSEEES